MSKLQRPKGTQDILPSTSSRWRWMEQTAQTVLLQAGYQELRSPILEHTELFQRGVGESTDIVSKEMFSFERSEKHFTLRPEGTAGIVRAYIENGLHRTPKPQRLFYCGPMFRYENPQKGRQRQFHQLGCELFGLDTPESDVESILLAWSVLEALGLKHCTLHINTMGDSEDRERFRTELQTVLKPVLGELCEDCQRRFEQNPLRMLDCKVPTCRAHYDGPAVQTFLNKFTWGPASTEAFEAVKALLTQLNVPFVVNPQLVRGLDYYSRTVFEITTEQLGSQSAVCGGGRYNQLVEQLGGPSTPAIGWAMGLERLFALREAQLKAELDSDNTQNQQRLDGYIVHDDFASAWRLATYLRQQGLSVEVDSTGRVPLDKYLGKQLKSADQRGAQKAYILGPAERAAQHVKVKTLTTGQEHIEPFVLNS